ncbi:MAG: hypothetical protein LBC02_05555 [Planctomycetaceae bacterium]|nr:hypothetical protein [Planctomycetaceae bacterium]
MTAWNDQNAKRSGCHESVLSKKFDEKYLKMYSVLKGHCITTHRNAVGTKSNTTSP